MTEFQNKSFSVYPGKDGGQKYRDNWDAIFKKRSDGECNCGGTPDEVDARGWEHADTCPRHQGQSQRSI